MINYYKFKKEDAVKFAQSCGIKFRERNDEMQFWECPYCHGGAKHDTNTFAINLTTGAFNCKRSSCGAHGNMITLARDFAIDLGQDVRDYYDPAEQQRFRKFTKKEIKVEDGAIKYMASRGISEEVTRRYSITMKPDGRTLVFPFMDEHGDVQFIKYRNTQFKKGETSGSKEWTERNTKPILYGMFQCDTNNPELIITEGQIDSLSVTEAGIANAVSVPTGALGFTWIPFCWDWMQHFKTLTVFGDHENGHITLLDEMAKRFNGTVKHVREEDYLGCKDANEILQKHGKLAIRTAISNAVPVENPHIKALADVKRVTLTEKDRVTTGLSLLDNVIGGFYYGQLIILTGERGKGKSTLASQFAAYAVENHINTFLYSGEMTDWQVQGWFERQIAGKSRINAMHRSSEAGSYTTYNVDGQFIAQIESWYRPYMFIYDSGIINGVEDNEKLTETLLKAIQQYDCKFFIIDNLMTAMDDDMASDIYREQTAFVKQLAQMAKIYEIIIILVAHPKKRGEDGQFTNDDVMGSSNITNLADVVLRYDEPKKNKKGEPLVNTPRVLQIWKNRLTGRVDYNGIPMYYQPESNRICDNSGFDHEFLQLVDQQEQQYLQEHGTVMDGIEFDTGPAVVIKDEDLPF